MKSKIKAVILDADGMVVHGERFSNRLEKRFGIPTTVTGKFFSNGFADCLVGRADLKKELSKQLGAWGWKQSVDDLLGFWFSDADTIIDRRFQHVPESLQSYGIKVCLATNNEKYRTAYLSETKRLGTWFDKIFSSADMGVKKPDQAFFQKMIDELGFEKGEVTFWDDDPGNIEGAKSFGVNAELYTGFEDFEKKILHLLR